jgi:hypothetical protein
MSSSSRNVWWYGIAVALISVCFSQLRWPAYFSIPLPSSSSERFVVAILLFLAIPGACWGAICGCTDNTRTKVAAVTFSLFAAGFCEVLHHGIVDLGRYDPAVANNLAWQLRLQEAVLRLEAGGATPHSYRFLPNCIVAFLQWLSGSFEVARVTYRLLANGLFFVMVYRYARIYVAPIYSIACVLVIAFCYPVTILRYAGQFTDPASYLSFAACLYCLAAGQEAGVQCSLFVGILAKESIVAAAICRAFYGRNRLRSAVIAVVYFVAAIAIVLGIRRYVNKGPIPFAFRSISGTGSDQLHNNLLAWREWWAMYAVTLGALIPGTVAGWRLMDKSFRATCIVIAAATLGSNIAFSLFWEERNVVPLFIPLAIVNMKYVSVRLQQNFERTATLG